MIDFLKKLSKMNGNIICYNLDILDVFTKKLLNNFSDNTGIKLMFALKANSNSEILRYMASVGIGADCASYEELELAQKAGFKFISVTSPGFTEGAINSMYTDNINVDFDNIQQLKFLKTKYCEIGIRVKLAGYTSRFGIQFDNMLLKEHIIENGYNIKRLHFHYGAKDIEQVKKLLFDIYELVKKEIYYLKSIDTINIGGGLEKIYLMRNENRMIDLLNNFRDKMYHMLGHEIDILLEPGSLLALPFGFVKTNVVSVNGNQAIMSVSAYNLSTWHRCKPIFHRDIYLNKSTYQGIDYIISGCSCYEQDTYGNYYFEKQIELNDVIIFYPVGAYNVSLCRNIHCLPLPQLIYYKGGIFYDDK